LQRHEAHTRFVDSSELAWCSSHGDSVEEALDMIKDAINGHLEVKEELKKQAVRKDNNRAGSN
jgi:predicted RNase H-like HicB family nuclease